MHLPPMIGVSRVDIPKGNQLAVLPLNSPVVAALREMEVSAPSALCLVSVVHFMSPLAPLLIFVVGTPWCPRIPALHVF